MKSLAKKITGKIKSFFLGDLNRQVEVNAILLAKLNIQMIKQYKNINSLNDVEFKVFSQWGEDGIIQYLINCIPIENKLFIEFGVENYTESNTRFLLINDNWKGLVIDGSEKNIKYIQHDPIYWRHDLTAVCCFITRDNINDIIKSQGIVGDIGLLSIDLDGMDYWVWEAIDVVNPRIVICEYNSILGREHALAVPYKEDFFRTAEHHSNLYYGASLQALCYLADFKGYHFVGSNGAGSNAFFVRKDLAGSLKILSPDEGYVQSMIRESRDKDGELTFLSGEMRIKAIREMEVYDVKKKKICSLSDYC